MYSNSNTSIINIGNSHSSEIIYRNISNNNSGSINSSRLRNCRGNNNNNDSSNIIGSWT